MTVRSETIGNAKSLATLAAEAALAGFELRTDPMGGFYVMRWGQLRMFDTLAEVERWLRVVTGRQAA